MPKGEKTKVANKRYVQPKMGSFFSKSNKKSSSKQSVGAGESSDLKSKEAIKRTKLEANLPSKRKDKKKMWGNWAAKDTEEYRNRYPGKEDHLDKEDNLLFYKNQLKSKPDGDMIDNIHADWFGDYGRLERHHGYIQWLFPIRETGLNWHSQELQLHEIQAILEDEEAKKRVLTSYKLMLDFYGMRLKDEETGEIERADNWKNRFQHLNRSFHNYLRITRILKCLGEFEYEHLKPGFLKFVLNEGLVERTLDNLMESCEKYWIPVIRDDKARLEIWDYFDSLYCEVNDLDFKKDQKKAKDKDSDPEKLRRNDSAEMHNSGNDTLEMEEQQVSEHRDADADEEESQEALYWQENATSREANGDNGSSVRQIKNEEDEIDLTEKSNDIQNTGVLEPAVNKNIVTGSDEVHGDGGHCKDDDDLQKIEKLSDESLVSKDEETKKAKMVEETDEKTDIPNEDKMNMDADGDKVVQSGDTQDKTEVSKTNSTNLKIDGTEHETGNDTEIMDSISGDEDEFKSLDNEIDTEENATENCFSDEKSNEVLDGMNLAADVDKEKNRKCGATEDVSSEKDEMEKKNKKISATEDATHEKVQIEGNMKVDGDDLQKREKLSDESLVSKDEETKQANMVVETDEKTDVLNEDKMNMDADGDKVVQSGDTQDKTEVSKTNTTNLKIDGTECEAGNDTEIMDSISGDKDEFKSSDNGIDTEEKATENCISDEKSNEILDGMDLAADMVKEKNRKCGATEDVSSEMDEMEEKNMKISATEDVAHEKVQIEENMKVDATEDVCSEMDEFDEKNMKVSATEDVTSENIQIEEKMKIDVTEDACEKDDMEVN